MTTPDAEQSYCDVRQHDKCDGRTIDDYDDCLCSCHPHPEEEEETWSEPDRTNQLKEEEET